MKLPKLDPYTWADIAVIVVSVAIAIGGLVFGLIFGGAPYPR